MNSSPEAAEENSSPGATLDQTLEEPVSDAAGAPGGEEPADNGTTSVEGSEEPANSIPAASDTVEPAGADENVPGSDETEPGLPSPTDDEHDEASCPFTPKVLLSGWLHKKSDHIGQWRRRFFLVRNPKQSVVEFMYTKEPAYKDAEGSLYEEGGPEARGVLELLKATVAEEKNPPAGRYGFKVTTEAGNVWDLRAELIDDRDAWMGTLNMLSAGLENSSEWLQKDSAYEEQKEAFPWSHAHED